MYVLFKYNHQTMVAYPLVRQLLLVVLVAQHVLLASCYSTSSSDHKYFGILSGNSSWLPLSARRLDRNAWLYFPRGGASVSPAEQASVPLRTSLNPQQRQEQQQDQHLNSTAPSDHPQRINQPLATSVVAPISPSSRGVPASTVPASHVPNSTKCSWRTSLPTQLQSKGPKTLQKICLENTDIYLLGTAHVSNDSSKDVRLLLNAIHPDCIFVELCDARISLLVGGEDNIHVTVDDDAGKTLTTNSTTNEQKKNHSLWNRMRDTQEAQGGSRLQALSTVLLTSVQEDYANELGVELGGEFRCAHDYWKNCAVLDDNNNNDRRPHLVLGDRPLHLTLVRAWESLGWWPKIKVVAGLVLSSLRKPNKKEIREWLEAVMREESDVLTESFQELRKHLPTLYTTIIAERDAWLAAKLTQTCWALSRKAVAETAYSNDPTGRRTVVVAIVGAGHVPGICEWLTTARNQTTTPETVLAELVTTRRWATDELVQREAIPSWIHEVSELAYEQNV